MIGEMEYRKLEKELNGNDAELSRLPGGNILIRVSIR